MIPQAILVTILILLMAGRYSEPMPIPTCPTICGNLTIPFPFGTTSDCSLDDSFLITCNHNFNPPKPFLNLGSVVVLDLSLDGLMKVASSVASDCYDYSGSQINRTISELTSSKFLISSRRNKFTAIGCDTHALVQGSTEWKSMMSAGCVSWCDRIERVVNGTCSGIGCCQTSIPKGVKDFLVEVRSYRNHTVVNSFNPCGYAFVVETDTFNFSSSDLKDLQSIKSVPVVLDWSVGYRSCQEALKNVSSFACRAAHSECIDSSSGVGYLCKCMTGFDGNAYLVDGCQDIDECIALEPCEGTCTNLLGSYSCSCPMGYKGDGRKSGEGCHSKGSFIFYIYSGLMVPTVGSSWIFWRRKQKKVNRLRWNLFCRNGGLHLLETHRIFTAEDLKRATNNYNENNVISAEVHKGIKYRGKLPDGRLVTIVKHDAVEECNVEEFINHLRTLSELCHGNIARLLGVCLETQAPVLVFEYFESARTLHDCILDDALARGLSWCDRLRIALETAQVLDYMHSRFKVAMIHGRLSSSSIILERCHTVKMQDIDLIVFQKFIVGELGYTDPHFLLARRLTEKSDVYSFGVILAEILTGETVISHHRTRGDEYLDQYFVNRAQNLDTILDRRLELDVKIDQLTQVAALAQRCLSPSPNNRPIMTEVAMALSSISGSETVGPNLDQEDIKGELNQIFYRLKLLVRKHLFERCYEFGRRKGEEVGRNGGIEGEGRWSTGDGADGIFIQGSLPNLNLGIDV